MNFDFEQEWGGSHLCHVFPANEKREIGNIFTPKGWVFWFRHEPGTWDQPEARDAWERHDPNRVHGGEKAFMLFTFYRKHDAGLYQRIDTVRGAKVKLTGFAHAWSNHNLEGHDDCFDNGRCSCGVGFDAAFILEGDAPPLNRESWNDAIGNFTFYLGVDPTGGTDPYADTVVWGRGAHIYNNHHEVPSVEVIAKSSTVTIFLRSKTLWAFKHNDAYWDDISLEITENGELPEDCFGTPRVQYERTYVLLPPNAGKEWVKAIADGAWDHRVTIGGSADDAAIGDLESRNVVAVNPSEWGDDLENFFQTYYPGTNYVPVEANTPERLVEILQGTPTPQPTRKLIGLHLQTMVQGWDNFIANYKPSVSKVLASMHDLGGIKRNCIDTVAVYRYVTNDYDDTLYAPDPMTGARRWIDKSRDGLHEAVGRLRSEFPNLKPPYFYFESLNEVYPSLNAEVVQRAVDFDLAFIDALAETGLPIKPVVFCAAVGNPHETEYEMLVPLARKCEEAGGLMGYHNYWLGNAEYGGPNHLWKHLAGRWIEMDKVFTSHGIHVQWYGGESGVVGGESGEDWVNLNAGSGWKDCYAGDWDRYLADIIEVNRLINEWNKSNDNRYLGLVLFTSGAHYTGWASFQIQAPEMEAIANTLK